MMNVIGGFRLTGWRLLVALTPMCVMAFPLCAHAHPVPTHSFPDMVALSEVIAFGRVVDVREGPADKWGEVVWGRRPEVVDGVLTQVVVRGDIQPPLDVVMMEAQIEVEVALQGADQARDGIIAFRFPRFAPPEGRIRDWWFQNYRPGERWLIFLRRTEKGLEPLNPLGYQDLRIPDSMPLPEDLRGPTEQQLEEILLWLITHGDETFQRTCLIWLDSYGRRVGEQTAQKMAFLLESENDEIRLRAARVLCQAEYAPAARVILEEFEAAKMHYQFARSALGELWHCPEQALAHVNYLLTDPDVEVRRAAVNLMCVIGDARRIPYLVKALDDPEFQIRYSAASALASATHSPYVTEDAFRTDESMHIQHWKQWWAEGGYQKMKDSESPMPTPPTPPNPS